MVRRSAHGRAWLLSALLVLLAAFVVVDSGIQDFFTPVDPVALSYGSVLLNLTESSEHNVLSAEPTERDVCRCTR